VSTATRKQVNDVLVRKKGGAHTDKKRRAHESDILRRVREAIKKMQGRHRDEEAT
jgi:hypothetical protein